MSEGCLGCTCSSARTVSASGQLVLATQVDHTVTTLRSLARRKGLAVQPLGPGLLSLRAEDVGDFIASARRELSSTEAEEVRCLVAERAGLSEVALLTRAMTAPSLAVAGARVAHADLLPLFNDEQGCFHAHYQPIVELANRRRIGYEALLRATAPDGTAIFPDALSSQPPRRPAGPTSSTASVARRRCARRGPGSGTSCSSSTSSRPRSTGRRCACAPRRSRPSRRECGWTRSSSR